MSRALDGSYWRVTYQEKYVGFSGYPEWRPREEEFSTQEAANGMCCSLSRMNNEDDDRDDYINIKSEFVRPKISIVAAVQRLVDARKNGVELWMRSCDCDGKDWAWKKLSSSGNNLVSHHCDRQTEGFLQNLMISSAMWILPFWIVATPEDAKKMDEGVRP